MPPTRTNGSRFLKGFFTRVRRFVIPRALSGTFKSQNELDRKDINENISVRAVDGAGALLCIEVIGLDILAEKYNAAALLGALGTLDRSISAVVAAAQGITSGSLTTRIQAFLPHIQGAQGTTAVRATQIAIQIQQGHMKMLAGSSRETPPLVLRIGVHVGVSMVAQIYKNAVSSWEMLGPTVKTVRSLTQSCEMGSVVASSELVNALVEQGVAVPYTRERRVRIMGVSDLVLAFEHDPLTREDRDALTEMLRTVDQRKREHERIPIELKGRIRLATDIGRSLPIDFSRGGIALKLEKDLAAGTVVSIEFYSEDGELNQRLKKDGMSIIHGEVRWAKNLGVWVLHGLAYLDLSEDQKSRLLKLLTVYNEPCITPAVVI